MAATDTQNAEQGCWFCLVTADDRADLNFDILNKARNPHKVEQLWLKSYNNDNARAKKLNGLGIQTQISALQSFSPALDLLKVD